METTRRGFFGVLAGAVASVPVLKRWAQEAEPAWTLGHPRRVDPLGGAYADIIQPGYSKDITHTEFGWSFEWSEQADELPVRSRSHQKRLARAARKLRRR